MEVRIYSEQDLQDMNKSDIIRAYLMLQETYREQLSIDKDKDRQLSNYAEKLNLLKSQRFGQSSERADSICGVASEIPDTAPEDKTADKQVTDAEHDESRKNDKPVADKVRKRPCRHAGCMEKVKKDLPVHDVQVTLTEEELTERFGGHKWCELPAYTYDVIRYVPAQCYVERMHVHVYKGGGKIVKAEPTVQKMFPKSMLTESLMAGILNDKFVLGLPTYRIWQEHDRNGLHLSRQSMSGWIIRCAVELFEPLVMRLRQILLGTGHIQADETPVWINHDDQNKHSQCRFWVFKTSEFSDGPKVIVFQFEQTRSTDVLREFCKGYEGTITCDAYVCYQSFAREQEGKVTITGCLTHCRRKYAEVLKAMKGFKKLTEQEKLKVPAYQALKKLSGIFTVEKQFKSLSAAERLEVREKKVAPMVDDFFTWVYSFKEGDFDKGGLMEAALNYSKNQEIYLRGFLQDGQVPIHNSSCEQSIIPLCIGRNAWKMIDSIDGGTAAAYMYTLAETAKANGAKAYYYFEFLLKHKALLLGCMKDSADLSVLDKLLPWSDKYRDYETTQKKRMNDALLNALAI